MKYPSFYILLCLFFFLTCSSKEPSPPLGEATERANTYIAQQDTVPYYSIITKSCSKRDGLAMSSYGRWQSSLEGNKLSLKVYVDSVYYHFNDSFVYNEHSHIAKLHQFDFNNTDQPYYILDTIHKQGKPVLDTFGIFNLVAQQTYQIQEKKLNVFRYQQTKKDIKLQADIYISPSIGILAILNRGDKAIRKLSYLDSQHPRAVVVDALFRKLVESSDFFEVDFCNELYE